MCLLVTGTAAPFPMRGSCGHGGAGEVQEWGVAIICLMLMASAAFTPKQPPTVLVFALDSDCGQLGHDDDRARWAPKKLPGFSGQ